MYDGWIQQRSYFEKVLRDYVAIVALTMLQRLEYFLRPQFHQLIHTSVSCDNKTEKVVSLTDTLFSRKAMQLIEKNKIEKSIFNHIDFVSESVVDNYLTPRNENKNNNIKSNEVEKSKDIAGILDETKVKFINPHIRKSEKLNICLRFNLEG